MSVHFEKLKSLEPRKEFFVGIDSDGCAFDTMEIKHKECFIPNIINSWDLQAASRFAREAAEFVNLYSQWRGINRFPGLVMVFDLLAEWDEPVARGFVPPRIESLRKWIQGEKHLGNPALEAAVARTGDPVLTRTLAWSRAVNETVERFVRGVPPFPFVRESLEALTARADMMVVSATPGEALAREWQEHDLARFARLICGQEMGGKSEHLKYAAGGKYEPANVLMIGDAPGDLKAAKANGFLFYPVNPGHEEASWQRFHDEAASRFFAGEYAGDYENSLTEEFMSYLPSSPPWKKPTPTA
ncbi:MAG: HAD hydrolase-like protein [Planctomycetota bacterium]|nr:HAD hydrolase-like protein [Planctomycetota bacterium]